MDAKDMKPATLAAQAGGVIDVQSGGVVPPIQPSTTFARDRDYEPLNADNIYARDNNDVARQAEAVLAQLEGGTEALLFPSGMAAIAALFRTVPNGGRVVVQSGIYWGTTKWIRDFCERRQIEMTEVEASDIAQLQEACAQAPAQIVWIETPSNPWLRIVDIEAAAEAAHQTGALLVVDSTAATPILSKPFALGADIVMHSTTKAINGHSDVLSGVLIAKETGPVWDEIATDRASAGAVLGPFEAWLLLRGMRTLPLRVNQMCSNAMKVAAFLYDHPQVEDVLYPGLPSHAGHDLACKQMKGGFGFLMSFLVKGGREDALKVAGRLNLFHRATSLGGVESLVEHRYTIEPHTGIPENLLRISIGIEDADDLIADLAQALGQ
ncbi:PLP-dependent aspartate aminotransferase family protein [Shimia thalassica]|uniref:trans-sulfuration enzyme family protein n=1 Tax=Shimia thalassica TaxID=1715693 RepID=UPI001C09CA2C|nr:PLP-dependent aspartate aminotransferase family protein [Shimia thalassica]MBU2943453.1 PLP-dependent aspartate aminotransferase family protein [Shimia thalassica]MDO6501523.1 PLP-dependent aspartate aminotransferase family protein [Shimia thalassica]